MRKAMDRLRGTIKTEVECRYPERFINICAANGVEFFDLRRTATDKLLVTLHIGDYRRLRLLAGQGGFTVRAAEKLGAPFFLWRMRRRWALITALSVCIVAVWISSFFILEIEVSGNEKVGSGKILEELKELGVGIGTMRLSISQEYISNEMLQKIPELSWIAVNCRGSHAEVLVREALPKPDIIDWETPTDVIASKSGIISKITVLEGAALLKKGDAVLEGETIVQGSMDSLSSGTRQVRATAEVWARTWYEIETQMPLEMYEKDYTGAEKTKTSIVFAGKRINLYFSGGNPWEYCDKITEEKKITLFGGTVLPVSIVRDTYAEYIPQKTAADIAKTETLMRERLDRELELILGDTGSVIASDYFGTEENGFFKVTLNAECLERIDKTREHETP